MPDTTISNAPAQPRRAILYMAWGKDHLQQAVDSAHSAAFMETPSILYTDQPTSQMIPDDSPFHRVIVLEMMQHNLLEKVRLADVLPEDYDSFVFLDADTRVLKDISFGFEMAERHGIAVAPASHYSMDSFHGFGRIMRHVGMSLRGQYLYNTGVIFFSRCRESMEVLKTWNKLAHQLTTETGFKRTDQPFFTLAMEQLGFNPYTLAPTYNYRALIGEHISGDVRVWHSYHPVPEGINAYDQPWHRRYRGSRKVQVYNQARRTGWSSVLRRICCIPASLNR